VQLRQLNEKEKIKSVELNCSIEKIKALKKEYLRSTQHLDDFKKQLASLQKSIESLLHRQRLL